MDGNTMIKFTLGESTRVCNVCGVEKPISEYYFQRGSPNTICKECRNKQTRTKFSQKLYENRDDGFIKWLLTRYTDVSVYNYYRMCEQILKHRTPDQIYDAVKTDTLDAFVCDYLAETGPASRKKCRFTAACRRYAEYMDTIK